MMEMIDDIMFWIMMTPILIVPWMWLGRAFFRKICKWQGYDPHYTRCPVGHQLVLPLIFPFLFLLRAVKVMWEAV